MTYPAATWPLNNFYAPGETTALFEAISCRQSCRRFHSAPSTAQWNDLAAAAKSLTRPGARIALGLCDTSLFQPFFGILMKFENVQRYAAVITADDSAQSLVSAGVSGEMLLLDAVRMGLAGVWVAGTYKKNGVGLTLEPGEKIAALIALGVPAEPPANSFRRKRKPLKELMENDFSPAPIALREIAQSVWAAPSALNRQPWRMRYEPEGTLYLRTPAPSLDLGIAAAHAVLALGNTAASFSLSEDGTTVRIELKP